MTDCDNTPYLSANCPTAKTDRLTEALNIRTLDDIPGKKRHFCFMKAICLSVCGNGEITHTQHSRKHLTKQTESLTS